MKKFSIFKIISIILAVIFVFAVVPAFINLLRAENLNSYNVNQENFLRVFVERVVDGDTIIVRVAENNLGLTERERVRLIGVDTPEIAHPTRGIEPYGIEASDFAKGVLERKYVFLDFDRELRDRYGRVLAYVYTEDGDHFNARLVKEGYGIAYLNYEFKYMDEFSGYENEAKQKKLGLWGL